MPGGLAGRGGPLPPGYRLAGPGDTVLHSDLTGYYTWDFPTQAPAPVAAAPAPVPSAVGEAAAAAGNGAISSTPIPISWGQRRIVGKVIDRILHPLNADGIGAEILDVCAGEPLFKDVPNDLVKIVADGTTIYDIAQGGIIHPGLTSVVWYDGTDDAQIQDPTFVAVYGADVTPGYVGLMHAILDFNSYAAWNGTRPGITLFIEDAAGGGRYFAPWGGTLDPAHAHVDLALSDGNTTAERTAVTEAGSTVRSTDSHVSSNTVEELRYVEFVINTMGGSNLVAFGLMNDVDPPIGQWYAFNLTVGSLFGTQTFGYNADGFWQVKGATISNGTGALTLVPGVRYGVCFDMGNTEGINQFINVWLTDDGSNFYGPMPLDDPGAAVDPIAGTNGISIARVSPLLLSERLYFAVSVKDVGDSISVFLDRDQMLFGPPRGIPQPRNWGDVFVELALHANLDPDQIITLDVTEESEGGVIYDGFSWTDVVTNAGKISNIDWWEDGLNIYVKQTALDAPPTDVDGIPAAHRYVLDEDHGSSEAERGGERRKPSVFELSYYDVSRQFQQSMVPARSEAHRSVTVQKLSVPFVMTAEAAATRSAIALGKSEMEMEEHKLSLPPTVPYVRLRPVDIVEFDEQERGFRTKVRSWTLDSDWGVEVMLQKLFSTAVDPTVPLELEAIVAGMPAYVPWRMEFDDRNNSGYVAAISGQ